MKKSILSVGMCIFVCGMLTGCGKSKHVDVLESEPVAAAESVVAESESTEVPGSETMTSEIQTEELETTSESEPKTTLTFIGHASVKLKSKDGTVIYIDPKYYAGDYDDKADYILVTHGHDDHQPNNKVRLKDDGMLITYKDVIHDDGTYEYYDFGNIQIQPVAAGGNANHDIKYCVGYLVTIDGVTVYHAGDTSMIEQMKELTDKNIDYAMYPIDGIYNMDAKEASEVANLVAAKHNIPIHENNGENENKAENFNPEGRLVLEYGETIVIGE